MGKNRNQLAKISTSNQSQATKVTGQITHQQWSGPLPKPDDLAKFEKVSSGLANRIMKMAEDEAIHRRKIEQEFQEACIKDANGDRDEKKRGQDYALAVSIFALLVVGVCAHFRAQWIGSILGGGVLVSLAAIFYRAKNNDDVSGKNKPPTDENAVVKSA